MDIAKASPFLGAHTKAVLVTLRSDGRPQSSNIVYHWNGEAALMSVTESRAKTANLRRDPRAALHVSSDDFWQYVVVDGTMQVSSPTTEAGDPVGRELLDVYNAIASDPHPDPDEFYAAMVAEQRLVLRLEPGSFYGTVR